MKYLSRKERGKGKEKEKGKEKMIKNRITGERKKKKKRFYLGLAL